MVLLMSMSEGGDKPKREKPLTQKQEAFCLAFIEANNATEAYRAVYNVKPGASPDAVNVWASELRSDRRVAVRIAELQQRAANKAELTRAWVLERLMRNADKAIELEDVPGSNKALELLGKTDELDMFKERSESKSTMTGSMIMRTVDAPPMETREEWLARRKREMGDALKAVGTPARTAN